jgi:diguanylate cyclase
MSASNNSESTYWKERYSSLVAELEQNKECSQETEAVLFRIINRVCSAVIGLDGTLDDALESLREMAKAGILTDKTRSELEGLADALLHRTRDTQTRNRHSGLNAEAIFTFLYSYMDEESERQSLGAIQEKLKKGEFPDESSLFNAIEHQLEAIVTVRVSQNREPKGIRPGLLNRLFGRSDRRQEGKLEMEHIRKNLLALLGAVEIPLPLQAQANHLQERLQRQPEALQLLALFEEVLELLVRIKTRTHDEQQSLETFLSDLNTALLELGRRALGMQAINRETERSSANFHATFGQHVEKLRSSSLGATDVGQLKRVLNDQLESISSYLAKEREAQFERNQEARVQIEQLSGRLQELEIEANELRTKLRIEHSMAMRDALTGLPNRTAYDEYIAQEIARWKRFHQPFCLMVWDIDFFKSINDRFGHKAGDKALVVIAETLQSSIRETDFVGRFGGEEFIMVLSGTDQEDGLKVADEIRGKVESCGFNSQGKPVNITISCGITQYLETDTLDEAFERADRALYQAKHDGRNRCVLM